MDLWNNLDPISQAWALGIGQRSKCKDLVHIVRTAMLFLTAMTDEATRLLVLVETDDSAYSFTRREIIESLKNCQLL